MNKVLTELKNTKIFVKDIKRGNVIRLKAGGDYFRVWNISENDGGSIVIEGCYFEAADPEKITTSPDLKVFTFAVVKIEDNESCKFLTIQPVGFWTDVITVRKQVIIWAKEKEWSPCEISWGSGGATGQFSDMETVGYFQDALKYAVACADHFDKKYK